MEFTRIESAVDVERLQQCRVTLIGGGGSAGLAGDLVRSGVGALDIVDLDKVGKENLCRQGHLAEHVGLPKGAALVAQLQRIGTGARISHVHADFTAFNDAEIDAQFASTDLFIFATDRFSAQARGNEVALRRFKPAIWVGLGPKGLGGEVIFWRPSLPCYRCLCSARYAAHERAKADGVTLDPPSDGVTIFDVHYIDAIAGMIAIGLLTQGSDNRFGRLIAELGNRNFLQVKIDPTHQWRGRDIVREQLQVPDSADTFVAWNTAARRDPTFGTSSCEDCFRFIEFPRSIGG